MDLSIVIPAYRAAGFLGARLTELSDYMRGTRLDYEIVVVDDGSPDRTADVIRGLGLPRYRPVLGGPHRGKFGAIAAGVAVSTGTCVLITDADVPYEHCAIPYFAHQVNHKHADLMVGDRTLPGSEYSAHLGPLRKLANRMFTTLVQHVVASGIHDSQCGIKAIRGDVARAIFAVLREPGFIGDVELLYVALKYNFAIRRAPVRLRYQGVSTVQPLADGALMALTIPRIWLRFHRGQYESAALRALARQDYWSQRAPQRDSQDTRRTSERRLAPQR